MVGAFTIVGLAGSYTRMLLKTESYNQVRAERETLRKNYQHMAQIAHNRSVQVASLGALANEVTALYGLRQNKLEAAKPAALGERRGGEPGSGGLAQTDDVSQQQVQLDRQVLCAAGRGAVGAGFAGAGGRTDGEFYRRLDGVGRCAFDVARRGPRGVELRRALGSDQRRRRLPFRDRHRRAVRHAGAGGGGRGRDRRAMGAGYGREVVLDHGHDVMTLYGHLSAIAVVPGQHVTRGQVIGYVGQSGRATGPHLHYEVRVHNVPVNPHKYLRTTYAQVAKLDADSSSGQ